MAEEGISFLVDLIGTASGLASFFSLGMNNMPTVSNTYNQILPYVGMTGGGSLQIMCQNHGGNAAGSSGMITLTSDTSSSVVSLQGDGSGTQAEQCTFLPTIPGTTSSTTSNSGSSVCIAGLSMTQNGGASYGWSGDTWAACGYPAYMGGIHYGLNSSGGDYYPMCAQVDNTNPSQNNGGNIAELVINFPSFVNQTGVPQNNLCVGPAMTEGGLTSSGTMKKMKRSSGPYQATNETRFVMSTITSNSAIQLCNMTNSYGPDYINLHENTYCDMSTRTLKKMCPLPSSHQCMNDCWRWDGNVTFSHWMGGVVTQTTRLYSKMVRHPYPLTSSDVAVPGACGTF